MATIEIPNVRQESTVLMPTTLKDNGVAVDWSGLQNIKAYMYSDAQRVIAGKCDVEVDGEDATVLKVTYAATRPQYLGVNSLLVRCKYHGREKSYDVPVLNFVERTAQATGVTVLDDPVIDVELEVDEVSTSLLDGAIAAALAAAAEAKHMVDLHRGPQGKSAYQVAVDNGFEGTEEQWLTSLTGPAGDSAYAIAVQQGFVGTKDQWLASLVGPQGKNAYQVAVDNGFEGTISEWLLSLKGAQGDPGRGITSVVQTTSSSESEGDNVITVTLSDGTTATFTVKNGKRGLQGIPGAANVKYKQVEALPTASAATMDFIYLVESATPGVYDMSYTEEDGGSYSWKSLGTTAIQLSDYASKTEVSQLGQQLAPVDYPFTVSGNISAGSKVFRFIVKSGDKYVVRAHFDTARVPKINAFYSCDATGGNRSSLKNNMAPDTDYLFTAASDIEYFTIYCSGVTSSGDSSFNISFSPEKCTYKDIDALGNKLNLTKKEALNKASGNTVPVNIVQGNYSSGTPNPSNTKRLRPDRMIATDELPIAVNIPDSVDAKLSSFVLYAKLDDYSSYVDIKTIIQRPKSFIITKGDIGNYEGFAFVLSKASDDTANLSPSDVSEMTIDYYDRVTDVREGALGRGFFYTDSNGLTADKCVFPCHLENGKEYLVEAITDSSASLFTLYACDSAGGSRTAIRNNAPVNKKFWLTASQDADYLCVYCSAPVTKGNFTIVVYDDAAKMAYINSLGVSGIRNGNFFYYGDGAISIRQDTKSFRGTRDVILSQNYYSGMVQNKNQSMAIFDGKIFLFQDTHYDSVVESGEGITVYDYETLELIGKGNNPVAAHCNNAQFTDIFWNDNDDFPLIMLSCGDSPSSGNAQYFHLLRISADGSDYTFTVVKTVACTIPAALNNGSWVANFRQKRLWLYTLTNGTFEVTTDNRLALYEFDMPDFSSGDSVTLTSADVKRYTVFDYCILQGATEHGGLLYLAVQNAYKINGDPFSPEISISNGLHGILVIDPDLGRVVNVVPFTGIEPEGIAICDNKILVSQKRGDASSTDQLAFQIQQFDFGPEV